MAGPTFPHTTLVGITQGICELKLPAGIPWGKILDTHCRYSVETTALNCVTATRGAFCLVFQRSRVQNLTRTPAVLIFPWLPSVCARTIREQKGGHDRLLHGISRIGRGLDGLSSIPGSNKTVFISCKTSRLALRTPTPPSQPPAQRTQVLPPGGGVKQPASDADHSTLSGEDAKNERSYTSITPIHLHGVERDSFTFTFTFYLLAVKIQIASLNSLHVNKQNG